MIRSFVIVVNLFIVMILKLISDGPTAEVKAPSSVKAGESFLVEVTIHTNGDSAFMRYSMELPAGWTAEQAQNDGGSYKFDKQNVKILWSTVGGKPELKISYRVNVPADASGDISLPCKISHPVNNLPANVDLDPVKISVMAGSAGSTYAATHNVPDSTAKPAAEISIERSVPTEPVTGEFIVSLAIHKDDLTSFGKVEDTLPSGFTATLLKSDGSDFKFENGVVRFGWYAGMPKKTTLNVQYKVTVSPDMNGNQTISGHFSYVENEKGKVVNTSTSIVNIKEKEVVAQNTTDNSTNNSTTSSDKSTEKVVDNSGNNPNTNPTDKTADNSANTSATNSDKTTTDKTADNSSSNPSSNSDKTTVASSSDNSGNNSSSNSNSKPDTAASTDNSSRSIAKAAGTVIFSVQIAAMTRQVPVSYYKNTFNISGTINTEQDNGLNKYTTGSFGTYQEARDHRNDIRGKGVNDAFVTAYNGGKRITVQEALMITSQKWVL